ncbi:MAG: hypothetical protein E7473_11860 [Ruminococcaceae bacterium]|nr:hypothetical protein [Oscillospiraceae bacterium]
MTAVTAKIRIGIRYFAFRSLKHIKTEKQTEKKAREMNKANIKGVIIPNAISAPKLYISAQSSQKVKNGSESKNNTEMIIVNIRVFFILIPLVVL